MKPEFMIDLKGKQFASYPGLLDEAHQHGLCGITTAVIQMPHPDNGNTAVVQAVVRMRQAVPGDPSPGAEYAEYYGLGDANPANVKRGMEIHLLRMAETRAKARALRDAVNIGVAAIEETEEDGPTAPAPNASPAAPAVSFAQVVRETVNILTLKGYSKDEAGKLISEHVAENDVAGAREFLTKCRTLAPKTSPPAPTSPARRPADPSPVAPVARGEDAITPAQKRMLQALSEQIGAPVETEGLSRQQASQAIDKLKAELSGGAR